MSLVKSTMMGCLLALVVMGTKHEATQVRKPSDAAVYL